MHRIQLPNGLKAWLVIDYALGKQVLADPRLSKDEHSASQAAGAQGINSGWQENAGPRPLRLNLLNTDPPDHTRLRSLVNKAFTPAASSRMRPIIENVAAELILALADSACEDSVDLLSRYATPLPITVICRLLGVPASDQDLFGSLITTIMDETAVADGESSRQARIQLASYLNDLVTTRRTQRETGHDNGDEGSPDLLDTLIAAQVEEDRLSDAELVATIGLLLVAGYDTTVHLIANTVYLLATNSQLRERIHTQPARIEALIEEVLRYEGPGHTSTLRHTTAPITLGGTNISAGEFLIVSVAAANRDPVAFTAPDYVDLDRRGPGHLSFGHGIHYCVGAPLARLEAAIAIGALVSAYPNISLAAETSALQWRRSMIIRGRTTLPIALNG